MIMAGIVAFADENRRSVIAAQAAIQFGHSGIPTCYGLSTPIGEESPG